MVGNLITEARNIFGSGFSGGNTYKIMHRRVVFGKHPNPLNMQGGRAMGLDISSSAFVSTRWEC